MSLAVNLKNWLTGAETPITGTAAGEVAITSLPVALTDRSGTITLGGTAQALMAANASRKGFVVYNNSAGSLWINELGATAVLAQPAIEVKTATSYTPPEGGVSPAAISIIGATTAQAFTAREW